MLDLATGTIIWQFGGTGDTGRRTTADIDPDYPGNKSWANMNSAFNGVTSAQGRMHSDGIPAFPDGIENNLRDFITSGSSQAKPVNYAIYWGG